MTINIVMANRAATILTDHAASRTIPAFQEWLDNYLCPAWGLDKVVLSYAAPHQSVPAGSLPSYLLNTSDVPGAGGYHENTGGVPDGKVFVGDAFRYGISWTVDFSHEIGEMLVDPTTDRWVPLAVMPGWDVIVEVGDPCEADNLGKKIRGVRMTDFALPAYFGLPTPNTMPKGFGRYDWLGHLMKPVPELDQGGYVSLRGPEGQIMQLFARQNDGEASRRATRVSRLYRKMAGTADPLF